MLSDVLRRHSKSCRKRGEHDEIASAKPGRRSRLRTIGNHAHLLREDAHDTSTSHLSRDTTAVEENAQSLPRYPITFLYSYTDPRRESILNAFINDPLTVQSSKHQETHDADHQLLDRDMALFGIFSDFFMNVDVDICASIPPAPGRPQTTALLQPRIDELCSQLFIYSQTCRTAHFNPEGAFPVVAAKAVFTAENFEECISAYFSVFHPQQPLIHWPTFDMHKVPLPLLLAVAFAGSVHCTPTDGALSSRSFFDLSEDFIFVHLRNVVATPNPRHDPRALEAVQAASLIVALQSSFNNEATRSRVGISRHPEIIAAMRSLKLLEPTVTVRCQNQVPEWNAFIAEESRVRAVNFIFAMDCMATFFFSSVPKIAIAEVSQTLPCNDVLYDAATEEDYARLRAQSKRLARPKPSIKQLVSALMSEDWSDEQKSPLIDVLEHRLLMICIFGRFTHLHLSLCGLKLIYLCSVTFHRIHISSRSFDSDGTRYSTPCDEALERAVGCSTRGT